MGTSETASIKYDLCQDPYISLSGNVKSWLKYFVDILIFGFYRPYIFICILQVNCSRLWRWCSNYSVHKNGLRYVVLFTQVVVFMVAKFSLL